MLRCTRPLRQVVKQSTGLVGLAVHPNPLPVLRERYTETLNLLSTIPSTAMYRQSTEAMVRHKLDVVASANGDVSIVEQKLGEGQIEQALLVAADELRLAAKMIEWEPWKPLEEKPLPGQWEYPQP